MLLGAVADGLIFGTLRLVARGSLLTLLGRARSFLWWRALFGVPGSLWLAACGRLRRLFWGAAGRTTSRGSSMVCVGRDCRDSQRDHAGAKHTCEHQTPTEVAGQPACALAPH